MGICLWLLFLERSPRAPVVSFHRGPYLQFSLSQARCCELMAVSSSDREACWHGTVCGKGAGSRIPDRMQVG